MYVFNYGVKDIHTYVLSQMSKIVICYFEILVLCDSIGIRYIIEEIHQNFNLDSLDEK